MDCDARPRTALTSPWLRWLCAWSWAAARGGGRRAATGARPPPATGGPAGKAPVALEGEEVRVTADTSSAATTRES